MFSLIRKRLTYANLALTVALVFAMSGGALAAGHYLITSTKQISPKVLKSLKGTNGKNGANGATGPSGPAGPAGPAGTAGATGPAGPAGPVGASGAAGAAGKNGTTGFTEKLPSKKTETGTWVVSADKETAALGAISFAIPLSVALGESEVHYVGLDGDQANCSGTAEEPSAAPGNLCVYQNQASGAEVDSHGLATSFIRPAGKPLEPPFSLGTSTAGATLLFLSHEGESVTAYGTWAVTAP
jgi:hypothetical protein